MARTLWIRCAAVLAPMLLTASIGQPTYSWRNLQIHGGGFVSGITFSTLQKDLLYARTDVGGVYRWQSGAGTWLLLTDGLGRDDSQLTGVVSLALDSRDSGRLYLACGQYLPSWGRNAAILRSSDQGVTWSRAELPIRLGGNSDGRSAGERLQVDPNLGAVLLLGTNQDGLWRSSDGAQSWTQVAGFPSASLTFVLFDAKSGSAGSPTPTLYAGANALNGTALYKSTDAGATWSAVPGQPAGLIPQHAALDAAGMLYLTYTDALGPNGASTGSVWKLDTSHGAWTNISPPAGQGGFAGLALDPQRPNTLVVSTLDRWYPIDQVYRSTDGGKSWVSATGGASWDNSSAPWSAARSIHWLGTLALDPFNSARAWFGTGYGVWTTADLTNTDAGKPADWIFADNGLEETVPIAIASPPSGPFLLSALGDIGGFRHTALDASPAMTDYFSTHRTTTDGIDFAENVPTIVVRTNSDPSPGSISVDGGTTWKDFVGPAPASSSNPGTIAISPDGSSMVWLLGNAGGYYSKDRGATWAAATGVPTSGNFTPVSDRVNASKFYFYDATGGKVYVSTTGGASFAGTGAAVPKGGGQLRAVFGEEGALWLPGGSGGLFYSSDAGATFARLSSVQEAYQTGFGKSASAGGSPAIYLWGKVAGITGIFRSDDKGAAWRRVNDDQHQFGWINQISGDPKTYGLVYLATGGRGIVYGAPVPTITRQPQGQSVTAGSAVSLSVDAVPGASYQWTCNGVAVAGASSSTLYLPNIGTNQAGSYLATVTTPAGSAVSNPAVVSVSATATLLNVSARAFVAGGSAPLTAGFVIGGSAGKRIVLRGIGPALAGFGVADALPAPALVFYDAASNPLASNHGWGGGKALSDAFGQVGAFTLDPASIDAALLPTCLPGNYTAIVDASVGTNGSALAEVYDADRGASQSRLLNLSARATVGPGTHALIAGFVVSGATSETILIRGVGPGLSQFGVGGVLQHPALVLYDGNNTPVAANAGWIDDPALSAAFAKVQAFALPAGSSDTALIVTVPTGSYTAMVTGAGATDSGAALVELYEIR